MKTELRIASRSVIPGTVIIELWHDNTLIGEVTGAETPGVRITSQHPMMATHKPGVPDAVDVAIMPIPI